MGLAVASTKGQWTGGTSVTIPQTANATAGRMVLFITWESNGGPTRTITGITGLGTPWTFRVRAPSGATAGQTGEIWYLDLPSTWSTGNIIVSFSGTIDNGAWFVEFVSSTTGKAIGFDTNVSLPVALGFVVATATATVTTDSAAPFVFACCGHTGAALPTGVVPASVNNAINTVSNGGGSLWQFAAILGGAGALAGATTGFNTSQATGSNPSTLLIDALTEVSANVSGPMFSLMGT